jgi:hypothetical protein
MAASARRTAYHEAGHAAGCLMSGLRFESVTSVPAGRYAGCVSLPSGAQSHGDGDFVVVMAGGIIADRLSRGRGDFTINTIRNWHQYGWLETDILKLTGAFPGKRRLLALVEGAVGLMRAYWPAVEAIAHALIEPTTLSYDDAQALLVGALKEVH